MYLLNFTSLLLVKALRRQVSHEKLDEKLREENTLFIACTQSVHLHICSNVFYSAFFTSKEKKIGKEDLCMFILSYFSRFCSI